MKNFGLEYWKIWMSRSLIVFTMLALASCSIFTSNTGGAPAGIQKQVPVTGADLIPANGPAGGIATPAAGAAIQAQITQSGGWIHSSAFIQSLGSIGAQFFSWLGLPADQKYRVQGKICVKNAGVDATQNLNVTAQVEYQLGVLEFIPMQKAVSKIKPDKQLRPGETQCYPFDLQFDPLQGAQYRTSVVVAVDNHMGWLPGTSNCPGPQSCAFGVRFVSNFDLAPEPTPTPTPTPEVTATPTRVYLPPVNSSGSGHSSQPNQPPPPKKPTEVHHPKPIQPPPPPPDPKPTKQPKPTKPPKHHKD